MSCQPQARSRSWRVIGEHLGERNRLNLAAVSRESPLRVARSERKSRVARSARHPALDGVEKPIWVARVVENRPDAKHTFARLSRRIAACRQKFRDAVQIGAAM